MSTISSNNVADKTNEVSNQRCSYWLRLFDLNAILLSGFLSSWQNQLSIMWLKTTKCIGIIDIVWVRLFEGRDVAWDISSKTHIELGTLEGPFWIRVSWSEQKSCEAYFSTSRQKTRQSNWRPQTSKAVDQQAIDHIEKTFPKPIAN